MFPNETLFGKQGQSRNQRCDFQATFFSLPLMIRNFTQACREHFVVRAHTCDEDKIARMPWTGRASGDIQSILPTCVSTIGPLVGGQEAKLFAVVALMKTVCSSQMTAAGDRYYARAHTRRCGCQPAAAAGDPLHFQVTKNGFRTDF